MHETTSLLYGNRHSGFRKYPWSTWIVAGLACIASLGIIAMAFISFEDTADVSEVGKFIHITDLHIDPNYREGSTTYSQCHRLPPLRAAKDGDGHRSTGRFGIPRAKCDSSLALINATRDYLRREWADKVDFVLWTGDSGRHDGDAEIPRTFDEIIEQNRIASKAMHRAFPPNVPIVPNIGNNDVSPHNDLPAPGHKRARRTFRELAAAWKQLVPEDQLSTFLYGGYFAKDVIKPGDGSRGLTVLSLNTMYWYRANAKVGGCKAEDSPGLAQIAWIRYQIRRARERNHDLTLIGHVSPNLDNYRPSCYEGYARTVTQLVPPPSLAETARNSSSSSSSSASEALPLIHAQLYGHSNVDLWSFVGQDLSMLEQRGDEEGGRLWWERQVDEETGRFGRLIREVWDVSGIPDQTNSEEPPLFSGLNESLWEEMADDASFAESKSLPSDFVDGLLKEFERVLMLKERHPRLGVATISPSIIPKYMPAFRVFSYARSSTGGRRRLPSGTLLDYDVYWADIAKHNKLAPKRGEFFQLLYRFSTEYKLPDLSPESYLKWARKLVQSKNLRKRFRALAYLEPAR
ncbi:Endopolyphosphatase [Coemansia sp. RSA 1813]|nr:Endopolyphosphatase [Coemansia sp. RSA 1646]KAJ1769429.1 Endopolyphosphatase [Coemansia sp. RSA 1843]KAJ2085558.1 Endopolyphosphatase [Coemansia sp. RSA 986]KAJ2212923.1 Endopolyphosphatase [Coemansia sp. RSA 487]KAJ2567598.1 Endopolyphosphatase [Coemansia sp. RSA 1813]